MEIQTITITDVDQKALENDLIDIQEWIEQALRSKINNCKKRMEREWTPRLQADPIVETIPANRDALILIIVEREDYKNRVQREVENEQ